MKLYAIRRPMGWKTPEDLAEAAKVSARVGDEEMSSDIRWIRSYVIHEPDGTLGTVCIYQASSEEKIREHANRAAIPATEIYEVAETVLVRPDPAPAEATA
jgi:thiamine biosynthesis protein ThiC